MSDLVYWVGRLFLFQLIYGGMIWFLIFMFVFTLGTESRTKWLKELWSWFEDKVTFGIYYLPMQLVGYI